MDAQEKVRELEIKINELEKKITAMRRASAATCALCRRQDRVRAARPNGTIWPDVVLSGGRA